MANRWMVQPRCLEKELCNLVFRVNLSAAAAITSQLGKGGTVTKTGTGLYRITLEDKWVALRSAQVTLLEAVSTAFVSQVTAEDVAGAGGVSYVDIVTKTAGANANVAAVTTLFIDLKLKNSTV